MMKQSQLAPGTNDNRKDCYSCLGYWPNGEGVFRCRWMDDVDPPHKCECCGYCDCFKPITDEDAEGWLSEDKDNGTIRRTTFNRWRWVESYEWR